MEEMTKEKSLMEELADKTVAPTSILVKDDGGIWHLFPEADNFDMNVDGSLVVVKTIEGNDEEDDVVAMFASTCWKCVKKKNNEVGE